MECIVVYALLCVLFGLLSPLSSGKVIPGGPWMSFTGNIVAPIALVVFLSYHVRTRGRMSAASSVALLGLHGACFFIVAFSWIDTWQFSLHPSARGSLFGP